VWSRTPCAEAIEMQSAKCKVQSKDAATVRGALLGTGHFTLCTLYFALR
jgi:hypothetical protein